VTSHAHRHRWASKWLTTQNSALSLEPVLTSRARPSVVVCVAFASRVPTQHCIRVLLVCQLIVVFSRSLDEMNR